MSDQPRRLPLNHVIHPYAQRPDSDEYCICHLWRTHHLHTGISSATCTCMACVDNRDPERCDRCHLRREGEGRYICKCPPEANPVPSSLAALDQPGDQEGTGT